MEFFPLPIDPIDRKDACDFIPHVDDPTGSGERMWEITKRLKMTQGATSGKTFGEVALKWQEKFIRAAFAEREDGTPVFRQILLLMAKKGGKSELTGKLLIANAIANPTSRGHAIAIAATDRQAQYSGRHHLTRKVS